MNKTTVKIGVIIAPIKHKKDFLALKYLILHQNTLQNSFEFQLLPDLNDKLIMKLTDGRKIIRKKVENEIGNFIERYRERLKEHSNYYGLETDLNIKIIILSKAKFTDNYYIIGNDDLSIIALGNWKHYMAPPSIIEFFLAMLVESSIDFACSDFNIKRHVCTKGCIFDFTPEISDARYAVLSGFLCSQCMKDIEDSQGEQLVQDVKILLQKNWLGTVSEPSDISITAKKLGNDLFHTKGITPTFWEKSIAILKEETMKEILKIIFILIGTGLLIYIGWKKVGL